MPERSDLAAVIPFESAPIARPFLPPPKGATLYLPPILFKVTGL